MALQNQIVCNFTDYLYLTLEQHNKIFSDDNIEKYVYNRSLKEIITSYTEYYKAGFYSIKPEELGEINIIVTGMYLHDSNNNSQYRIVIKNSKFDMTLFLSIVKVNLNKLVDIVKKGMYSDILAYQIMKNDFMESSVVEKKISEFIKVPCKVTTNLSKTSFLDYIINEVSEPPENVKVKNINTSGTYYILVQIHLDIPEEFKINKPQLDSIVEPILVNV